MCNCDKRAFPLDLDCVFRTRMYKIRIEKLSRNIQALENRAITLKEQNDYYRMIVDEKNLLLKQQAMMINSLGDLLAKTVEELS